MVKVGDVREQGGGRALVRGEVAQVAHARGVAVGTSAQVLGWGELGGLGAAGGGE